MCAQVICTPVPLDEQWQTAWALVKRSFRSSLHYAFASVNADGTPHVVPVAWIYNAARDTIDIGGHELELSKKFRDVARSGRAAIVIDDLASTDPWRPRAVEVRGRAEAITLPTPLIRIHPERIISWGLGVSRSARTVVE